MLLQGILLALLSAALSMTLYPSVRRFAVRHGIVDNPDARKLQRVPVPVLGGFAVFCGFYGALIILLAQHGTDRMLVGLVSMAIMMCIGIWDDVKGLPALFRFVFEIGLVAAMMYLGRFYINDFHGVLGIGRLPLWFGVPLSIIAGVGIINAINLIDGVDGYCSGYGIASCLTFAGLLIRADAWVPAGCLLILAGALVPFFLHNVFGKKSKMFIGDGGSLMLGTAMTIAVFYIVDADSPCAPLADEGLGLLAFTLAVLAIPVFDTLRVMIRRIMKGRSPFSPDKTHLHHLFIEMGFSHVGTSLTIILINLAVTFLWWVSYRLGASVTFQFFFVIALGLLVTTAYYAFVKVQQRRGTRYYAWMCSLGERSHQFMLKPWKAMRRLVDKPLGLRRHARLRRAAKKVLKKIWGGER